MTGRRTVVHVALLAGPLLLVQGFRMLSGTTPASASASPPERDPLLAAIAATATTRSTPSPEQAAALKWLAEQTIDVAASPMNHAGIADQPAPSQPARLDTPMLTVTSIVSGSGGLIATINGRGRRIGDRVADGWVLATIDLRTRSIIVRHTTGATARAFLTELDHPQP